MGVDPNQSFDETSSLQMELRRGEERPGTPPRERASPEGVAQEAGSVGDGEASTQPFRLPTVPPITSYAPSTPPPVQPTGGNNPSDYQMQFGQFAGGQGAQPVYGQPIMSAQPYALQPLPIQQASSGNEEKWTLVAAVVFFLGFFCCPIWLAGAFTLKRGKYPRYIGSTSLCYAGVTFIIFVVYFIIGRTAGGNCVGLGVSHCFDTLGCGWCRKQDKCTSASDCGGLTGHAESEREYCNYFDKNPSLCKEKSVCRYCGDDDCAAIGTRC